MKCPKCQTENPENLKFCGECGAKLEKVCPHCNSSNPPQFKFCGECGRNLSIPSEAKPKELSFDEKLAKINYPAASGRGIRRAIIGDLRTVSDISFPALLHSH